MFSLNKITWVVRAIVMKLWMWSHLAGCETVLQKSERMMESWWSWTENFADDLRGEGGILKFHDKVMTSRVKVIRAHPPPSRGKMTGSGDGRLSECYSKILVLDSMTSNADSIADSQIQSGGGARVGLTMSRNICRILEGKYKSSSLRIVWESKYSTGFCHNLWYNIAWTVITKMIRKPKTTTMTTIMMTVINVTMLMTVTTIMMKDRSISKCVCVFFFFFSKDGTVNEL